MSNFSVFCSIQSKSELFRTQFLLILFEKVISMSGVLDFESVEKIFEEVAGHDQGMCTLL